MSQLLEVSLAECLEVKDAALDEAELWAILTQTLERIDALFTEAPITRLNELLPITPESIFLCPNGQTDLTSASRNSRFYEDCLPPEFLSGVSFNNDQLEKMLIFSLGMSVYSMADYNLTSEQDLNITSELDEFLSSMCTKNPKNRINLDSALKACSGNFMSITPILDLHRMVLGQTDIEMHPVEEKTYDYSYEVFKANKIPSRSQVPSEASTIHYILLDRGPNMRSSSRSFDTFDGQSKINDKKFEEMSAPSEGDIEETFIRLNNRRRRLESLRKGLRKLENDDLSEASMNLARLSNLGMLPTNKSTLNLLGTESQQPMNFLSSEYEWLDRRAREIDDWRRNHLTSKEVIIAPDPVIREADIHQEHKQPQTLNDTEIQRYVEPELPSERQKENLNYVPKESFENESIKSDTSKMNVSFVANIKYPVKVDEEVQTRIIDPINKLETDQTMVGPEFRLTYPTVNLTVREACLTSESNMRHAKVRLLNGSEVDVLCCPTNTGQQLYECIAAFLFLKEPHLFGLALPKDEELLFFNKELELRKVAPLDWNERKKFRSRTSSFLLLHFCIQYFIPNTSYLMYSSTLHLFYLQLRQHILSGRLQINDIQSNFLVAALALKAEYGNRGDVENFSTWDYLPETMIRKSGEIVCRTSTLSKWRGMSSIPQRDAERIFVEKCMAFKEYGYHFYRVSKVNNILSPNNTWIGLGIPGVAVGRDLEEARVLEALHNWSNTLKISYNRHRFSISNNSNKFNYYTDSFRKCRYLLWLASDQHFFKMIPVPLERNEAGIINDVVYSKRSSLEKESGLQNAKVEKNQKQEPAINSSAKDYREPTASVAQDDRIQLSTQNKLLKYLQEKPQLGLTPFDFDDILKDDSIPSQVTFETATQEDLRKPDGHPKSTSTLPAQKVGQEVNKSHLNSQNKLLSYLQEKPQVDLPVFKLGDDVDNLSNPTPIANKSSIRESPIKPERMPNQKVLRNKDAIPSNSSLEKNNGIPMISPLAASKVPNNSSSLNKRPPAKSPRLFKDSQSKSSLSLTSPSVLVNDFSNQSEVSIPTSSGIKLNPLYQDEESSASGEMDSYKTPVPALRGSLLKESSATQNPAASQKAEDLRERIKLTLERKAPNGYGIGLARDRKHEGVFIVSLLPGGVADSDGRLVPGDEIKAINGEDVSGSGGYSRAIELLSQNIATLEVERKMAPLDRSTDENSSALQLPASVNGTAGISEFGTPLIKAESSAMYDTTSHQKYQFEARDARDSNNSPTNSVRNIIGKFESIPQTPTNLNKNNNNESPRMRKHSFVELDGATSTMQTFDEDGNINILMSVNDIIFVDKKTENAEIPTLPNDIQEIMRVAGEISDLLLLSTFKNNFTSFKNSEAEELEKLINKLENQLNHDQPIIEFKGLAHPRRNDSCLEGSKPDERLKNRFQNVLPFDSSRVVLQSLHSSDLKTNNYINASHIKYRVGRNQFAFIATQAPLLNTTADFWMMIWQNNVKFISMLTKEFENGQNKCCHYWPNHKLIVCNQLEVTLLELKQLEDFDLKLFHMVDLISSEQRIVCHSTFQNWPHEPRTQDTTSIMKFISLMDHFSGGAPVVVHCSAGIGRTGVLIALKISTEFLRANMKFDLKTIIEDLRKQRGGMVQTRQHYQLCYQAILDVFKLIFTITNQ